MHCRCTATLTCPRRRQTCTACRPLTLARAESSPTLRRLRRRPATSAPRAHLLLRPGTASAGRPLPPRPTCRTSTSSPWKDPAANSVPLHRRRPRCRRTRSRPRQLRKINWTQTRASLSCHPRAFSTHFRSRHTQRPILSEVTFRLTQPLREYKRYPPLARQWQHCPPHPKTEECTSAPLAHPFRHSCSGNGDPFGSEGDEANIGNADLFRVPPSLPRPQRRRGRRRRSDR